jgi:hypothetical protein
MCKKIIGGTTIIEHTTMGNSSSIKHTTNGVFQYTPFWSNAPRDFNAAEFGLNISLHVFILFSFLSFFYFFYAIGKIEDAFEHEFQAIIDNDLGKLVDALPSDTKIVLDAALRFVPLAALDKYTAEANDLTEEHNTNLRTMTFTVMGFCLVILLITFGLLTTYSKMQFNAGHVLAENLLKFACVGVVEYFFFTEVAFKYTPARPSLLTTTFSTAFKDQIAKNAFPVKSGKDWQKVANQTFGTIVRQVYN